jgi:hypothetical protein
VEKPPGQRAFELKVTGKGRLAVVLVAGPAAAILLWLVRDRHPTSDIAPAHAAGAVRPIDTVNGQLPLPKGPNRDRPRAEFQTDGSVDAALDDFQRTFQAATEEELDLVAAEHLPGIVRRDPQKAARFVELQSPSQRRDVLIRHVSRLWGASDAEAALVWAQSLPEVRESGLARRAVCLSMSQTDPAAAVRSCEGSDAEGDADFQGIFQSWVQMDPSAAGKWLAAQPTTAKLEKLRQRYVHVLAKTDPVEALRMAQESFTFPADRDEAVLTVLHQWALHEPNAAWNWAAGHAPEHLEARALAEIEGLKTYVVRPQASRR